MLFNFKFMGNYFIQLVLYFSLYSFLGWCTETIYATIKNKRFTNRGFLYGPFCPMYGFAAVLLISIAKPVEGNYVILYLICFFGASVIEYFTGFLLEKLFNAKWWDYSKRILNIQGRICILYSLLWGLCGIFIVKVLQPLGHEFVTALIPKGLAIIISHLLVGYFVVDLIITLIKLSELKSLLKQLDDVYCEVKNILINVKITAKERVALVGNKSKERIAEAENLYKDIWSKREVIDNIPKELKERYENIVDRIASRHSRIFLAFPQFNSDKFKKAFSDIRNKIKLKVR